MSDQATRYPLSWPAGWKRTDRAARQSAKFSRKQTETYRRADGSSYTSTLTRKLTLAGAVDRLQRELDRLGAGEVVLSTNIVLRLDGLPRSGQAAPADPGAAVYFKLRRADRCLACDRYLTVEDNIAALAAHIEALRAIERYGVGTLDQAFAGYAALPASAEVEWWIAFGLPRTATLTQVDEAFRRLALTAHPDKGGSHVEMARLTTARDAARKALA